MHLFLRKALLLFFPLTALAYPNPEPCTGWCFKDIRDPSVVLKDNTFYRFATHGNFTIATAPSISGPWTKKGAALHNGSMISIPFHPKATKEGEKPEVDHGPALWAPDVVLIDDTYYLTYTVTRGGRPNEIGIATSKILEPGSWQDHGSIEVPESDKSNRIDSNLFQALPGSKPLLAFGSYLDGLFQVTMTLPPMQLDGEVMWIAQNKSNVAMEAAYQFQWSVEGKQWFYLFFSSGRCCNKPYDLPPPSDEYKIMVCRSASPTGPFVDDVNRPCLDSGGKMVLGSHDEVYGPGGQGVLYDEQLRMPVMYYHYMNHSTGYQTEKVWFGWNRLSFESGWPVVVTEADLVAAAREGKGGHGKHGTHESAGQVQRPIAMMAVVVSIGMVILAGMAAL